MKTSRMLQIIINILKFVYILLSVLEFRHSVTMCDFDSLVYELCSKWSDGPLNARYHHLVVSLAIQCSIFMCFIITTQRESVFAITTVPSITIIKLITNLIQNESEKRFYLLHMMIGFTLALLIKWKGRPLPEPELNVRDRGNANRG